MCIRDRLIVLFEENVKRATKILVTAISGEMFYLWDGFPENPRQLWIDLVKHFQTQTHSHRASIRAQLDASKLKDNENPNKWLKERIRLYQQYGMSGQPIDEIDLILPFTNLRLVLFCISAILPDLIFVFLCTS